LEEDKKKMGGNNLIFLISGLLIGGGYGYYNFQTQVIKANQKMNFLIEENKKRIEFKNKILEKKIDNNAEEINQLFKENDQMGEELIRINKILKGFFEFTQDVEKTLKK
jgi:uncharacterized protein HemX